MNTPLTIKETQDGLKSKKFSAVELVDLYLSQIKKYNSEYNIFLTVTEEEAYKKQRPRQRRYIFKSTIRCCYFL